MEKLKNSPRFYYINLERSKERKERIENMFQEYNLDFKRIEAVDGKNLSNYDSRFINAYEYGCTLSHLKAIQQFYDSNEEYGIICEDDMTLEFLPLWKTSLFDVIKKAPNDWEVIMLGYILFGKYDHVKDLYNKFIPAVHCSTISYCINRSGAKRILEKHTYETPNLHLYKNQRPVADMIVYDNVKTYVYKYSLFTYPNKNESTIIDNQHILHDRLKVISKNILLNL